MDASLARGGEFLLTGRNAGTRIFSPEDFNTEQRQIAETTEEFMKSEILPNVERIENKDFDFIMEKLRQCADLGLFLAEVPEEYGGLELEKTTNMLMIEKVAPVASFVMAFGGHTGIGMLPLVYYGTPEQKERYLGKLATGEWIGAYALTEPDCGSDPLSSRSTAVLSADGSHYILNGTKQFITNSAFADLFTVFARIDGKHFSAFLVEKGYEGFSVGAEERKMGLKGSSTTPLALQDVKVPVENLLGEAGKGHKIAFNVLNVGRLKVATQTLGMSKAAFGEAASYAAERKQFGRAIRRIRRHQGEAGGHGGGDLRLRVGGLPGSGAPGRADSDPGPWGADYYERYQKAIEEYAAECAIAKVFCSEQLDMVVDEAVQIHGGYGYISEYAVERHYRDSRIQRIFEGTNEINRILIPTMLFRKADDGGLDLWRFVREAKEMMTLRDEADDDRGRETFSLEFSLLDNLKTLFLGILGDIEPVRGSQEILLTLADMVINVFALESSLLRAEQVFNSASEKKRALLRGIVKLVAFHCSEQYHRAASRCSCYAGLKAYKSMLRKNIQRLTYYPVEGFLEATKLLAEEALCLGCYKL